MKNGLNSDFIEEIAVKFLVNLPREELNQERLGFHFESAFFYYVDQGTQSEKQKRKNETVPFCDQLMKIIANHQLPKLSGLQINQLIEENYARIPVHGVIILNMQETKAVMVQSRGTNRLGFPKGKIREGQDSETCAMREAKEEIGLKVNVDPNNYVEVEMYPPKKLQIKNWVKVCRFYIVKVEESCIVPRNSKDGESGGEKCRQIIHSSTEIKSIKWYQANPVENSEMSRLKNNMNTVSKIAYEKLALKLKNPGFRQKIPNPLEEFKGFNKRLGSIFLK